MTTYKIIKRKYYESIDYLTPKKDGLFVANGTWADGHLAYSRLDENGNEIEEEKHCYIQFRSFNGGLYMLRILVNKWGDNTINTNLKEN